MTTSAGDLNRFLDDLRGRRQRLLRLVGADDDATALLEELQELSEQLIVADEELRVQQEQLESTRRQLESLASERERLFATSTAALVLTDAAGVVLQSTPAAQRLVQQPAVRVTPRPIATWFEVADRSAVRRLISRRDSGEPLVLQGVRLRRPDGGLVRVDLEVTPVAATAPDDVALRWELEAVDERPAPGLAAVPAEPGPDLATDLTELTSRLANLETVEDTLAVVVAEAVRMLPAVEQAEITGINKRGDQELLAATADMPAVVADELTVPLGLPGYRDAVLRLRSGAAGSLDAGTRSLAELLAVHFRVATTRVVHKQNLERAMVSRQLIGQAVGVLVERRRLTPAAAFDELVRSSQRQNIKLREIARVVVETGQNPDQVARA